MQFIENRNAFVEYTLFFDNIVIPKLLVQLFSLNLLMKNSPTKIIRLIILLFILIFNISCSKDSDLLLDSVLNDSDEKSLEDRGGGNGNISVEEGFVLRTFTFSPTNDAYLQDTQGYDQHIVRLQEDLRTSYLMFDLSPVNGEITDAVLQLSIDSDEGDGNISVYKGISSDWVEENLTSSNAPQPETELGSVNKSYKLGALEKLPLNVSQLQAEKTTLVLKHSQGNDLAFASKENSNNKGPKLVVTYIAPEDSPEIEEESNPQQEGTPTTPVPPAPTPEANQPIVAGYYVTVNGKATNDGLSEATSWSIQHAFSNAKAGDVVYIKAGNYGNIELFADNSGTSSNPIQFIGYTNIPGDLVSNESSTFNYEDQLDASKMPLINGISPNTGVGLTIQEGFTEIHNLQITDYQYGIISHGKNVTLKNIITNNNGEQNNNNVQGGRGFHIYGDFSLIENCFSLNSNGEAINLKGANNCIVRNTQVYSDNLINMGGYYIAVTFGGSNNIIEGCTLYRDPSGDNNLPHQGHGFIMKDQATNNIVRNCKTYNTGIEVNFSGVHSNTFENIEINGNYSTYNTQYSSCITINNGAHHNTFNNITIKDTRYPVVFIDFDDGYVGPGGDRDENQGGHDNVFINMNVDQANSLILFNSKEIGWAATSADNVFQDCVFKNVSSIPFSTNMSTTGTKFINSNFENFLSGVLKNSNGNPNALPIEFENCNFINVGFQIP